MVRRVVADKSGFVKTPVRSLADFWKKYGLLPSTSVPLAMTTTGGGRWDGDLRSPSLRGARDEVIHADIRHRYVFFKIPGLSAITRLTIPNKPGINFFQKSAPGWKQNGGDDTAIFEAKQKVLDSKMAVGLVESGATPAR